MIIEMLADQSQYQIIGLLDKDITRHGRKLHGLDVLGSDHMLEQIKQQGVEYFVVGIGATKSCLLRQRVYHYAISLGMKPITVIDKSALIMESAVIGEGSVIMPKAVINRQVKIGCNVIVNSSAVVEHDAVVGDHSHVATAACVCGGVKIGEAVMVGANATIRESINVGDNVVVGAGSGVTKNISLGQTVVGCPAKALVVNHE